MCEDVSYYDWGCPLRDGVPLSPDGVISLPYVYRCVPFPEVGSRAVGWPSARCQCYSDPLSYYSSSGFVRFCVVLFVLVVLSFLCVLPGYLSFIGTHRIR